MAQDNENTIVIEEPEGSAHLEELPEDSAYKKKRLIVLITAAVLAFIALMVSVYFAFVKKEAVEEYKAVDENISTLIQRPPKAKPMLSVGEIERMIEKAKTLYKSGDKAEALRLYEQISLYNESASAYNLGVAKMEDGNCEEAIGYLNSSIKSGENELPALVNSAVCSLKMGKERAFKKYIALAKNSLHKYANNPLYSYYYTLIRYYENDYYQALASINSPTSKYYDKEQSAIAARIYLGYDDSEHALSSLQKLKDKDNFAIGLLYARLGNYQDALASLLAVRDTQVVYYPTNMALQLISMKVGAIKNANNFLEEALKESEVNASKVYPIEVFLKEDVFESDKSQQSIADNFLGEPRHFLGLIFYFANYKIFSPNKTVANITKGSLGLMVNQESVGSDYLQTAAKQSTVNAAMIKGLEYVFEGHVVLANKVFKELEKTFPNNSVLLFNLALSYAQLGEYQNAAKFFLKAYHYDSKNIESGVYSLLLNTYYGRVTELMQAPVQEAIARLNQEQKDPYIVALYGFAVDNYHTSAEWLRGGVGHGSLDLITAIIVALKQNKMQSANKFAAELRIQNPDDIVANAVYMFVSNYKKPVKSFALQTQEYLTRNPINYNKIFYGPDIGGESFIALARISGMLSFADQKVSQRLGLEIYDRVQLLKIYSLVKLYEKLFEESYKGYSELILKQKSTSARSLFHAGVASIAANRYPDAISFFEINKIADQKNPEIFYALGLLYQEATSLSNAANQYKNLPPFFESSFFDFDIAIKQ